MRLWCLFVAILIFTMIANSYSFMNGDDDALINYPNVQNIPPSSSLSLHVKEENRVRRSSVVKRSQRNANILYRYCRRNGQAPNFCLKYAITMIFATGH